MKKKFISLLLAFFMLITVTPMQALAKSELIKNESSELDFFYETIDGQDYIQVKLPPNSVEIVEEPEDPFAMRLMGLDDNVPNKDGAGQKINWGTGVLWKDYNNPFPPVDPHAPVDPTNPSEKPRKKYIVTLTKKVDGKKIEIAEAEVKTAVDKVADIEPDKPTTYQFITNKNYKSGDENLELFINFPIDLNSNILYDVNRIVKSYKFGKSNNKWYLIFLEVDRLTAPTYTAEWETTSGALKPTIKGKITTGSSRVAKIDVFNENNIYGTICKHPTVAYIDEKNLNGEIIGNIIYRKLGPLNIDNVIWRKGENPVMSGEFVSYSVFENGGYVDKPLGNTKGRMPRFTETKYDYTCQCLITSEYPTYFYNLVGDRDHMWRFQMKEGLELKFNTGVGKLNEAGEAGQDIGNTQTIAYGEKFDSALKGSFSENTLTLPETTNLVAPTLNKNNLKMKFIGWKLVQGSEVPVNPQQVETDGEGKQTLTAVQPDYETTDALKAALTAADFKGFTEKNPIFYAIYGQTQGKANIKYVDDKGTQLAENLKINTESYPTKKFGNLNEAVTATTDEAPQFKGYAISKVEIEPTTGAKYEVSATATIKFVYKVKATTDDKSTDTDYIKVTFNANGGHFGTETEKTKGVYVLKNKATFADAKEKVTDPTIDNATFNEWQTAKTGGQKVVDNKTLSTADETFYANYIAEINATKIWVNGPTTDHKDVKINLFRQVEGGKKEAVEVKAPIELKVVRDYDDVKKFYYTWKYLPATDEAGNKYTYTVEEANVTDGKLKVGNNTYVVTQEGNTITNTYEVPKTEEEIVATKQWVDVPAGTATPPVKFQLQRTAKGNTEDVGQATAVTGSPNGQGLIEVNFGKQDKTDTNGNEYVYTVKELDATGNPFNDPNYTSEVIDLAVRNIYQTTPTPATEYTVTFDNKGHGTKPADQTVEAGKTAIEPTALTAEGFDFGGWYTDENFEFKYIFTTPVNSSITLYAKWTEKTVTPEPTKYTVTFDNKGHGTKPADQTVEAGKTAIEPTALTAEGFDFGGWYTDENFEFKYIFTTPVNSSITLYAKWTETVTPPTPPTPDPYIPPYTPDDDYYIPYRPHRPSRPVEVEEKTEVTKNDKEELILKVILTENSKELEKYINASKSITLMDVAPYIKNGRIMLPIRYVAEALGMSVSWDAKTRTVIIQDMFYTVEIPVDTNIIKVNGEVYTSDVKPEIKNARTMLPIANIARALGLKDGKDILWDAAKKQVTIIRTISR